jgi:hypothetical protein
VGGAIGAVGSRAQRRANDRRARRRTGLDPAPDARRPAADDRGSGRDHDRADRARPTGAASPLPELEPAEGVAAFRALAEATLTTNAQLRAWLQAQRKGRGPRLPDGWGGRRTALWQRAVREQQRLRGTNAATADYVVTEVVNHLGFLAENALWFDADPRLRAARDARRRDAERARPGGLGPSLVRACDPAAARPRCRRSPGRDSGPRGPYRHLPARMGGVGRNRLNGIDLYVEVHGEVFRCCCCPAGPIPARPGAIRSRCWPRSRCRPGWRR